MTEKGLRSHSKKAKHGSKRVKKQNLTPEQIAKRTIVVTNISPLLKEKHIIAGFSSIGRISKIDYVEKETGGECTITYHLPVAAVQAVTCINNYYTHGSQLFVKMQEYKEQQRESAERTPKQQEKYVVLVKNISLQVTCSMIENLFSIFKNISECKEVETTTTKTMRLVFSSSDSCNQAIKAMNGFSLKGNPLSVCIEEKTIPPIDVNKVKVESIPQAIGYVAYKQVKGPIEDTEITNSCIVLVTGFGEGDNVKDPQNIAELKRIAVEYGKLKDLKYAEIGEEKRLFFKFSNAYSAKIAVSGFNGLYFNSGRLKARQYNFRQFRLNNYSLFGVY